MTKIAPALVMLVAILGGAGEVWAKSMKAILRGGFLALALLLATAVPVNAGPYEDGLAAYDRGDFASASRIWQPLAKRGSVKAQKNIYENGEGASNAYDPIFIGGLVYPIDRDNFSEFLKYNEGKLVYINSTAGHAIFYEQYLMIEKCKGYIEWISEEYNLDDDYLFGHPNKDGKIYYQLINEQGGDVSCGPTVQIETSHATIGVLETGTGLAVYPIEGFFEVVRTGNWNHPLRYHLIGRDVEYSRIEAARKRASTIPVEKK